jgi:hypothetical protein
MEMNNGFWSDGAKVIFYRDSSPIDPQAIPGVKQVNIVNDGSRGYGAQLILANDNLLSIMWRAGNYCSNRYESNANPFSEDAEIAIIGPDDTWHSFGYDTVAGWQSVDDILGHIATFSRRPVSA